MNPDTKKRIFEILDSAIVVAVSAFCIIGFILALKFVIGWTRPQPTPPPQETITPPNDRPPFIEDDLPPHATATPAEPIELKKLQIISPEHPYVVTENPYANVEVYKDKSLQLALVGDFATASLVIKGDFTDAKDHFLSVNLGTESGIYNAVRSSANTLNKKLTEANLGVFSQDRPIDLSIDLMASLSFAPTGEDFLKYRQSTKLIKFWDFIKPSTPAPSINRILVVPFNEAGQYTGTITALELHYACVKGLSCKATLCSKDVIPGSKCILDEFGKNAFEQYKKYFE